MAQFQQLVTVELPHQLCGERGVTPIDFRLNAGALLVMRSTGARLSTGLGRYAAEGLSDQAGGLR